LYPKAQITPSVVQKMLVIVQKMHFAHTVATRHAICALSFRSKADLNRGVASTASVADPKRTWRGMKSRSAAVSWRSLREMVPGAVRVAVLVNPANVEFAETTLKDGQRTCRFRRRPNTSW
jgi:hypothetical protein